MKDITIIIIIIIIIIITRIRFVVKVGLLIK